MKPVTPETLAVRAINQYRRRDVLAYLALRYYLDASAARSDIWSYRIATNLVLTRHNLPYLQVQHFKDIKSEGKIEHRRIVLPCANEALAEIALLAECAKHPEVFGNPERVFSYELSEAADRTGAFQHYIVGLKKRHQAIVSACEACPDGVVLYTDIQRFYPSITIDMALASWQQQAELAGLSEYFLELGKKIIVDHGSVGDQKGILTGPMFSHLVGNLVLRKIDEKFSTDLPVEYFRYVDDIILVGENNAVTNSLKILQQYLKYMSFKLHDSDSPKTIKVTTGEWLVGRNDYSDSKRIISWPALIGDLKRFLLQNPDDRKKLQNIFRSEGFRIPVHDYSGAVHESSCLERIIELANFSWFINKNSKISINSILNQARWLRNTYEDEFRSLMREAATLQGYEKKRRIPKLRYRASRLIYLATDEALLSLSDIAVEVQELFFHAQVMRAVSTGNIDSILQMGTNAAQAAAQPLRASGKNVTTKLHKLSSVEEHSLAVFFFNGVHVEHGAFLDHSPSELIHFAMNGSDISLMKSSDPFIREMACLHGLCEQPKHPDMLDIVFDEDEELALDAIDHLQDSWYI